MTDPQQTPRQPHTTAEVRWAAMRLLLADLLAASVESTAPPADRDEFVAALRAGADVRDLAAVAGMDRDQVIATLARLVRE